MTNALNVSANKNYKKKRLQQQQRRNKKKNRSTGDVILFQKQVLQTDTNINQSCLCAQFEMKKNYLRYRSE